MSGVNPSRNEKRRIAHDIKKMKPEEVYKILEQSCLNYGDEIMKASQIALHNEFGFGKDRMQRYTDAVNAILKEASQ